ncbi:bifunctional glutamate N-acetyltransferase/amino-acid acetyltransferase ArgJ [Nioella nitratireducens]|uniref:bifunctional glutamate N-acetyltransferase/amino-acid acetyltransferase ArgJ n=1 Tax=Nioella nitratireducens TaxID=1287720 RepID=UPI0008FD6958|nr:bifunctional glutamate N-acetyltransferase/amino-acid acetyltransferase ArgJ [Nioella nitratireducens]
MAKKDKAAKAGASKTEVDDLKRKLNKLRKKLKAERAAVAEAPAPETSVPAVSPLAPKEGFPAIPAIDGVRLAAAPAGVKYKNRNDVMLVEIAPGSSVAGVFTRSSTRSAPVRDCEDKLAALDKDSEQGFAIIVNSGNSNAFTGHAGQQTVDEVTGTLAKLMGLPNGHVFSASTGVIGEPLPAARITDAMTALRDGLDAGHWEPAARAIMTTDTFAKGAMAEVEIDGQTVHIAGFAKGSGMIAPDMATMLGYVFTDAAVSRPALQSMLKSATNGSFNAITVDSDTSTSDTVMLAATGKAGNRRITSARSADGQVFAAALQDVLRDLALQIVRDGEGATKLVEVRVTGAKTPRDADKVARSIANSPLVKTAIAGEDPNWGRVVMAVGKSGATADRDLLTIRFGDVLVAEKGWVSPTYSEEAGAAYMTGEELLVAVDLGLGDGQATVWTCDLTHQYISINADYRS